MKSRYINTKFWSDPFIGELNKTEKLLFLYFLTNEHTNISGIYEISLRVISFETGVDEKEILKVLDKFKEKIIYHNGHIIIKNFYKHQQRNAKINIGIASHLQELPVKIISKLHEIKFPVESLITAGNQEKAKFEEKTKNRHARRDGFSNPFTGY